MPVRTVRWALLVLALAAAALALSGHGGGEQEQAGASVDPGTGETVGEFLYGLTPARLLDTRPGATDVDGRLTGTGPLADGRVLRVAAAGRGGIPADATSVLLNVTAVGPQGEGFLSVWPDGPHPGTSNLNFRAGDVVANLVFTPLHDGAFSLLASGGSPHVLVDVVAYYSDQPTAG